MIFSNKVGIDLGTSRTRVYIPRSGIVVDEPTVVARNSQSGKIEAIGQEALAMLGRTPDSIEAYYPLKNSVIADFNTTTKLVSHFINKAVGKYRMVQPDVLLAIPSGATSTERKAALDAVKDAGAKTVHTIPVSLAAALGAHIEVSEPLGNMVIDLGAGSCEVALLSLGGVVNHSSVRTGGNDISRAITAYVRKMHSLAIGEATAEELKHTIATATVRSKDKKKSVHGRDLIGGMPKSASLYGNDLLPCVETVIEKIVLAVRKVIEHSPPELVGDIMDHGIMVTGGTANLDGVREAIKRIVGVPCVLAQDSELCTIKGVGIALEKLDDYKRSITPR